MNVHYKYEHQRRSEGHTGIEIAVGDDMFCKPEVGGRKRYFLLGRYARVNYLTRLAAQRQHSLTVIGSDMIVSRLLWNDR